MEKFMSLDETAKRLVPTAPKFYHEVYVQHEWEKDEEGRIDEWALDIGFCNGPRCANCGYSFCENCNPDGWNDTNCVNDWFECPGCGKNLYEHTNYCPDCGQALDWEATKSKEGEQA